MVELIAVPLKKPSDIDVIKPLENVIKSTQSLAASDKDYMDGIMEFSKLRKNALWRAFEKFESSLELICRYYDQICALEEKIPTNELQIPFKWKDAFDRTVFGGKLSLTISTLAYERVCVLFNIAALQSSVAAAQSIESDEGLKLAAKLFQQSAGIFSHLKSNIMLTIQQEPTPDMSPETLEALSLVMLAQAQEIFTCKAIHDNMKEGIIAKLATQAEELYSETLKLFQKEIFRAFWDKEWIPLISGKQLAFRGLAEYYQSLVCKSKKQVGEEIARLEYSVEMFKTAQAKSNKLTLYQEYLNKATRNLTEAKKDNEFIYHERIPDIRNVEPISKASLAKITPLPQRLSSNFQDIFADLLPISVHHALGSFETQKSELVNFEITKLRNMRQFLNGILASLNLPAAIEDVSGTEVPQSLVEKATFINEAGGIKALESMMNELPELLQRNKDILDEAERMLEEERSADERLREQFKTRWTRLPSNRLAQQFHINCEKYRKIIDNAVNADKLIKEKFETHREAVNILSMNPNALASYIPTGTAVEESRTVNELRKLMEEVETLKAEQDVIESELQSATTDMKSKFLSALAKDGVIDEKSLIHENITSHFNPLQQQVHECIARQGKLIEKIKAKHMEFTQEQSSRGSAREQMLCKLAAAYDAFKELRNNLQEGVKFYNDLTQLLIILQNKISDFCFARKTEKEELLKDLTKNLSESQAPTNLNIPTHHADAPPAPTNPMAPQAPQSHLPYPMQNQGTMPVPYGATTATPYPNYAMPPVLPMPTTFNPYATLSYNMPPGYMQQPQMPYQNYQQPHNPNYPHNTL